MCLKKKLAQEYFSFFLHTDSETSYISFFVKSHIIVNSKKNNEWTLFTLISTRIWNDFFKEIRIDFTIN